MSRQAGHKEEKPVKTRLLALVMAVVLCLSILPMAALAEAEVPAEEIIAAEEAPVLDGAAKPAMPTLTSVKNLTSGVKITWEKVKKADGYIIFRRSGSGAWERIGKVKKGTKVSYIDKTAESGTRYSYSVCIYTGTKKGSHDADGLTILRLDSPVIKSTRVVSSGIKITWNKVTGAKKYAIYRKAEGDEDWTKLGAVKALKYTDKTAQPGAAYTYTVRAVSGKTTSAIRAGKSAVMPNPALTKAIAAYKAFTAQSYHEDEWYYSITGFALFDLNKDGVPELFTHGGGQMDYCKIFTYSSGEVQYVHWGSGFSLYDNGIIEVSFSGMGYYLESYYRMADDLKLELVYRYADWMDSTYTVGEDAHDETLPRVTSEDVQAGVASVLGDAESYDLVFHDNTDADRTDYLRAELYS